jgi:hypothetical protein
VDTPATESSSELNIDSAAQAFNALMDPSPAEEPKPKEAEADKPAPEAKADDKPANPEPEAEENAAEEGDDAPLTIEVDGKQVTLTKEQIAEAYKSGLRQSDYTQKTMAAAEERKAAEAERTKAQQERVTYAQNLQKMAAQLEGALQQQAKIDWDALIESNPVEALRQQHLLQQRQAALQENTREQERLAQQFQTEQAEATRTRLIQEHQALLGKLPEWKDAAKAKAEGDAIKQYLMNDGGYTAEETDVRDHRAVVLARKAMLYDQMMAKASAAAKRVANVPTKVERPGVPTERSPLDGRTAAFQRLSKSGSIDDAAAVFNSLLS